jgi:hypothetical protein
VVPGSNPGIPHSFCRSSKVQNPKSRLCRLRDFLFVFLYCTDVYCRDVMGAGLGLNFLLTALVLSLVIMDMMIYDDMMI